MKSCVLRRYKYVLSQGSQSLESNADDLRVEPI